MNIAITEDAAARLCELVAEEGGDAVVRIRETKVGSACKAKFVLKLSIDERDDDDAEAQVASLPFVANQDLLEQYGEDFTVRLDENGMPDVAAGSCACACGSAAQCPA